MCEAPSRTQRPRVARGFTGSKGNAFRRKLLRWFRRHGRDLPWRRSRNPYHILVSEFMLQQTQVTRVLAYYPAFLQRYPTLEVLAAAPAHTVRESWDGLGYYRRAANLHRLAQEVVATRGGLLPSDPAELRLLPGIGRYTAGAVATFGFERSAVAVDTNVARVLQRAFHPRLRGSAGLRRAWTTAEQLVPRSGKSAWAFNQAIMELGALVCTARVPRCRVCPVQDLCATGRRQGSKPAAQPSIAPANKATRPKVPAIEATMRCRARSSSK
jgi:A/G-specific adenine glycosylase